MPQRPSERCRSCLTTGRNGPVVGVKFLRGDEGVMLITGRGMIIRLNTADISTIGRNTQGVRLITMENAAEKVAGISRLPESEAEESDTPATPPVEGAPPSEGTPPASSEPTESAAPPAESPGEPKDGE